MAHTTGSVTETEQVQPRPNQVLTMEDYYKLPDEEKKRENAFLQALAATTSGRRKGTETFKPTRKNCRSY